MDRQTMSGDVGSYILNYYALSNLITNNGTSGELAENWSHPIKNFRVNNCQRKQEMTISYDFCPHESRGRGEYTVNTATNTLTEHIRLSEASLKLVYITDRQGNLVFSNMPFKWDEGKLVIDWPYQKILANRPRVGSDGRDWTMMDDDDFVRVSGDRFIAAVYDPTTLELSVDFILMDSGPRPTYKRLGENSIIYAYSEDIYGDGGPGPILIPEPPEFIQQRLDAYNDNFEVVVKMIRDCASIVDDMESHEKVLLAILNYVRDIGLNHISLANTLITSTGSPNLHENKNRFNFNSIGPVLLCLEPETVSNMSAQTLLRTYNAFVERVESYL